MASPERLVRAEEDITAISDTVLDIKATVDAHTETLSFHGQDLADIKSTLAAITSTLGEILTAIRRPSSQVAVSRSHRPTATWGPGTAWARSLSPSMNGTRTR